MKIQFLNGGLANQAFQYIFTRYYELTYPGQIMYMDDSYFALNTVHNGYELEKVFGIKPHMLSTCFDENDWNYILSERRNGKSVPQILNENGMDMVMVAESGNYREFNPFSGKVFPIPCNEYHPEILTLPMDTYYHGYWINKSWIREYNDIIRKDFAFPQITEEHNKKYLDIIKNTNSVALHIRRGDYVTCGLAVPEDTYYKMCEAFIYRYSDKWRVIVFSDDIQWCRDNAERLGIHLFEKAVYIEGNIKGLNYRDMQLMMECKGMIMSTSAFCYLAALLRDNKDYILNISGREL